MSEPCVIVPNWNGEDSLKDCLDSLRSQTLKAHVIVVDNGSVDGSLAILDKYGWVEVIRNDRNLGFAAGVNAGFRRAMKLGAEYAAAFNNDAVADKDWLKELVDYLERHDGTGIATPKILTADGRKIDSTGDFLTVWGLPYPRGRDESDTDKYDLETAVFGASGGASLYRVKMLEQTGLFDEDFFAYYEDVDLSFRARLAGWQIAYVPSSVVRHAIGATSGKIKGFTTYQTMKNQPLLLYKDLPGRWWWRVGWRFTLAHTMFFLRAIQRGQGWQALKGDLRGTYLLFRKHGERQRIQRSRVLSDEEVWKLLTHDLPPNARSLRRIRRAWRRLTFRKAQGKT